MCRNIKPFRTGILSLLSWITILQYNKWTSRLLLCKTCRFQQNPYILTTNYLQSLHADKRTLLTFLVLNKWSRFTNTSRISALFIKTNRFNRLKSKYRNKWTYFHDVERLCSCFLCWVRELPLQIREKQLKVNFIHLIILMNTVALLSSFLPIFVGWII